MFTRVVEFFWPGPLGGDVLLVVFIYLEVLSYCNLKEINLSAGYKPAATACKKTS